MKDVALDEVTGDVFLATGDFKLIDDPDSIRQQRQIALSWIRGEWKTDLEEGFSHPILDRDEDIPTEEQFRESIRAYIAAQPGHRAIIELKVELNPSTREAFVDGIEQHESGYIVPIRKVLKFAGEG